MQDTGKLRDRRFVYLHGVFVHRVLSKERNLPNLFMKHVGEWDFSEGEYVNGKRIRDFCAISK